MQFNGLDVPVRDPMPTIGTSNLFAVMPSPNGTDDTAALQKVLDRALTFSQHDGAFFPDREPVVYLPPDVFYNTTGITVPQGVILDMNGSEIRGIAGATKLITLGGDRAGVRNGFLQALVAPTGVTAVHIPVGSFQCTVERMVFNSFGQSAILVEGNAAWINRCWAQNCVKDADTLSVETGALHVAISGNDCWVRDCEFSASRTALSSSGKAYAVVLLGKVGTYDGIIGEISDHGWFITGLGNRITGCRADLNRGHGFVFSGGSGALVNCLALDNGRETTNTYDGFNISGTTPVFQFAACVARITTGNTHRFGFNDTASNFANRSMFDSTCKSVGHGTAAIQTVDLAGGAVKCADGPFLPVTAASTTWDVQTYNGWPTSNWELSSVAPVNFTDFTRHVSGMRLVVRGDGQTTFVHNAAVMAMKSGANTLAASGTYYQFINRQGVWIEL